MKLQRNEYFLSGNSITRREFQPSCSPNSEENRFFGNFFLGLSEMAQCESASSLPRLILRRAVFWQLFCEDICFLATFFWDFLKGRQCDPASSPPRLILRRALLFLLASIPPLLNISFLPMQKMAAELRNVTDMADISQI